MFAVVFGTLTVELARPFVPHLDEPGVALGLLFDLVFNLSILAVFWAFGVTIRARRETEHELVLRADELERQREENARRAVFDERVRIARELHDVVAHHVSVIGLQAGAARRVMAAHPDKAQVALTSIESASRHAVVELHKLLGFLRQEGEAEELAPNPTLRDLDELVEQVMGARLNVELFVEGERRAFPSTLEVSAYRLVQEALTNTLKHAEASNATVRLCYRTEAFDVEILDDGRGDAGGSEARVGGHGLIGMRERLALHGGRLRTGPRPEGGFEVWATFPLNGAAR